MKKYKFNIVDAFSDNIFGGNPAGVVILNDGEDFPQEEIMLKTAAELRYSETAFIKKLGDKHFNIRYFTPAAEVDLCGHATIGSFFVLMARGIIQAGDLCINETKAGILEIQCEKDKIFMDMGNPTVHGTFETEEELSKLYAMFGTTHEGQLEYGQKILIPEMVSTGLIDIMLPLKNEEALENLKPNFDEISKLSEKLDICGVHAFTLNSKDGNVHARNFCPRYDIDEEAATGTSNGALSYYLYKNGILKDGDQCTVIQGEAMNRPSKIVAKINADDEKIKIKVGGFAAMLAEGEIYLA